MKQLNFSIIEGNVVQEPKFSRTKNDKAFCKFTIANNNSFKKEDKWETRVSFISVETWGKLAETCKEIVHKGKPIRLKGQLKQSSFLNEKNKKINYIRLVASSLDLMPQRKKEKTDETQELTA